MPSEAYLILRSAHRACPRLELGARLEGRTTVMQPFVSILSQARRPGSMLGMGTGRSLSSGRPKAGPVGRCDKIFATFRNGSTVSPLNCLNASEHERRGGGHR